MPGLIGFIEAISKLAAEQKLARMASELRIRDTYKTDLYCDEGIGLGRVGLRATNPYEQPIWNEEKTICALVDGEIYSCKGLSQDITERVPGLQAGQTNQLVLKCYEQYGDAFAAHLNGAFVAVIWDGRQRKLVISNDHLGMRPLYYACFQGKILFSSGLQALLVDPKLSRKVNATSIAQMLCFEYVIGQRTLLDQVFVLPPASVLTYCNQRIEIQAYWKAQFAERHAIKSTQDYLEGLIYYLRQAVARQAPGELKAGVNLSGGLDSRFLIGLLSENPGHPPIHSYTFGTPDCNDARFAREVARKVGSIHRFFELKSDFMSHVVNEGVRLTGGLESCVHMHALANLGVQAREVDILYSGFLLDAVVSSEIKREWWANYAYDEAYKILFDDLNVPELFRHPSQDGIFSEPLKNETRSSFDEAFREMLSEHKATQIVDWENHIDLVQRQRRFTNQGNEIMRGDVIARTPFGDKDLVEFSLTLPPGLRYERFILRQALGSYFHELAKIPWEKTGFPIVPSLRELRMRANQQIEWQLQKIGVNVKLNNLSHSYTNYDGWFRNEMKGWVEGILLDKRCLERGYFNPDAVRNLVAEQMAGANHARKLGILMTIELWHRQALD